MQRHKREETPDTEERSAVQGIVEGMVWKVNDNRSYEHIYTNE